MLNFEETITILFAILCMIISYREMIYNETESTKIAFGLSFVLFLWILILFLILT